METTLTPAEVASKIIDVIERKGGKLWDQGGWFGNGPDGFSSRPTVERWLSQLDPDAAGNTACGTTACVAGWASIFTAPPGTKVTGVGVIYPDGRRRDADNVAEEVLHLGYWDADWLFAAYRSREEVLRALKAIRDGEPFDSIAFEDADESDESGEDD